MIAGRPTTPGRDHDDFDQYNENKSACPTRVEDGKLILRAEQLLGEFLFSQRS
jgi:hypothetical protein